MKSTKWMMGAGIISLVFLSLACSLPAQFATRSQTPIPSTPNITLTAIVAQLFIQATMTANAPLQTEVPVTSTDTPLPTSTMHVATSIPPTPTQTVTETPIPTISYEGPNKRSGDSIEAVYMYDEPTIDGVLDEAEWEIDRYDVDAVVYGNSHWNGENDLSANFMLGWDEEYLYVAAKVKDNKYVQNTSGINLFKGDSIEILMDTSVSKDYYLDELSKDDFQLGISPGSLKPGKKSEAYLWYPEQHAGGKSGVKIGAMEIDEGYRVEAKIPWNVFRIEPEEGMHYGFVFSVSDNDKSGESVQQSLVSCDSNRELSDPTTWSDLILTGSPASHDSQPGKKYIVEAEYLDTAPSIDGDIGDWNLEIEDVSFVTYGREKWSGDDDLSGNVMVGWDEDYLYLGVTVIDDSYQQRMSGEYLYLGDSLEILFDRNVEDDFWEHKLSSDDYQLGISPGRGSVNSKTQAYMWNPASKAGGKSKVKISGSEVADGYVVEVAIPWNALGGHVEEGQHFGFVFSISDNDHSNKNLQQTMVSSIEHRIWNDPSSWGVLILIE